MKLGEVLTLDKNNTISIEDDKIYIIAGMQSYGKGVINKRTEKGSDMKMKKYQVIKENQLMWCKVDTKNGAFGVTTDENIGALASTNMALADIDLKKINPKFLQLLFTMPYFYNYINGLCTGTTNRKYLKVSEVLEKIEIPDISLQEQDRIIKKYCEIEKIHIELRKEINKQELYVNRLRESILKDAIRGKLVPQDESDEPASVLLERIRKEKERLVKEKKIKKEKSLPEIDKYEIPYELPNGWEWVRLGNIGDWGAGATPPRGNNDYYNNGKINWIKTGELNDGYINSSEERITELALSKCSLRLNKPGDVLIAMYGATIGKLGILNIEATTNQACCGCTVYEGVYNRYLFNLLLAMRETFRNQGVGGAQPNISRQKIISTVVPLPPLNEQKRIVKKVDKLMKVCDELELRIEKNKKYSEQLMESILKDSLKA